jgi:hypothetical protein
MTAFLYRSATILSVNNTLFIVLIEDYGGRTVGYYPLAPIFAEVVQLSGVFYLRYTLDDGSRRAVEFDRVGIVANFTNKSEFFGDNNNAIKPVIELVGDQNKGLSQGIKNAAGFRFYGRVGQTVDKNWKDLDRIRDLWQNANVTSKNLGGIGLYDQRLEDLKQVKVEPFSLNSAQMKSVEAGVFRYFGVPENIIANDFSPRQLEAFIKGKIEPFALQLSEAMSGMTFSERERAFGNAIEFHVDELANLDIEQRLDLVNRGIDRGLLMINEGRELLGFPRVEDGDVFIRRLDYGNPAEVEESDESEEKEVTEDDRETNSQL